MIDHASLFIVLMPAKSVRPAAQPATIVGPTELGTIGPVKRSTSRQTAAIEPFEDAGVRGAVGPAQIGQFKKRRLKKTRSVLCDVQIYPLEVTVEQTDWPEKHQRSRIWVPPRKATKLVKKQGKW